MWPLECVVLEDTLLYATVWELHAARPVLDSMSPLAPVVATIVPVHFAVPVPLIILVTAFVVVAGLPHKEPDAVLFIVLVGSLEPIAIMAFHALLPLAFTVLEAVFFTSP